jgi:hypothetical protein
MSMVTALGRRGEVGEISPAAPFFSSPSRVASIA